MSVHPITGTEKNNPPATDWALGPGSMIWKVMRDPIVFFLGQVRTAPLLLMHPPFAASSEHDTFVVDPLLRNRRVGMYAYGSLYGTKDEAQKLTSMVRTRHGQVVGIEPITQRPYQSNSEYELALTHVIEKSSYIAIYEAIHGELTTAERDQFMAEFKAPSAALGINPDHLPDTYQETLDFLDKAMEHFAVGPVGRNLLCVFDNEDYEPGTAMGDLPWFKRKIAMFVTRMMFDMGAITLTPKQRRLLAINRRPKLLSRHLTLWTMRGLSKFMTTERGQKVWEWFLQKKVYSIYKRAMEAESAPGYEARKAAFQVPDAQCCYEELYDLKRNWPGSIERYALGLPADGELAFETEGKAAEPENESPQRSVAH